MAQSFKPDDFLKSLMDGNLESALEKTGMVKPIEGDATALLFSQGTSCEFWTRIPISMISSVEYETMIQCREHQHPLVRLRLKQPDTVNAEANVLASLLRSAPVPASLNTVRPHRSVLLNQRSGEVPPLPTVISRTLAQDYGIGEIIGLVQCAVVVNQILSDYDRCIIRGGSEQGCANVAARNIAQLACRSYCNCE